MTDISHLDEDEQKKLLAEGQNHQGFFTQKHYSYKDEYEEVGRDEHYVLKWTEEEVPPIEDRHEPYCWYYAVDDLNNIPIEEFDSENLRAINLDRIEPSNEDEEHDWVIVETNTFATEPVNELEDYIDGE